MKKITVILLFCSISITAILVHGCKPKPDDTLTPMARYNAIQAKLKRGWGTFNNKNVLSHVLLPDGLALNIGIKSHEIGSDNYLRETLISSRGTSTATVRPGYKSFDGSYSRLTVTWKGIVFNIESASIEEQDVMLLITPVKLRDSIPSAILEAGILWNRPGTLELRNNQIKFRSAKKSIVISTTGSSADEYLSGSSPYLAVRLDKPVAFYTGRSRSFEQIIDLVATRRSEQEEAERMVTEHLLNPNEFYGEWMIPSIARNVPAFKSQDYWRGRIWGPMNFLVYLGLRNYKMTEARKILAEKSSRLMMENVSRSGYIYENYNALTGNFNDPAEAQRRGDKYYHWGALLGFIQLMEAGYWDAP